MSFQNSLKPLLSSIAWVAYQHCFLVLEMVTWRTLRQSDLQPDTLSESYNYKLIVLYWFIFSSDQISFWDQLSITDPLTMPWIPVFSPLSDLLSGTVFPMTQESFIKAPLSSHGLFHTVSSTLVIKPQISIFNPETLLS